MIKLTSATMLVMGLSLLVIAGCRRGGAELGPAETLMKESVDLMNDLAAEFENAKKVSDVKPKFDATMERIAESKKKFSGLTVTDAEKEGFKTKYEVEFKAAGMRMSEAMKKLALSDPEGMKAFGKTIASKKSP